MQHCQRDFQALKALSWPLGQLQKRWDAGLGQVAVHKKGGVSQDVVVIQLPVGCDVLYDPIDPSFESLEHFNIKFGVDGCPGGINSWWTTPLMSKKIMSIVFTLDLLILAFFGCGDTDVCHSEDCLFVRVILKTQNSSPVITFFKKWGSFSHMFKLSGTLPLAVISGRQWALLGPSSRTLYAISNAPSQYHERQILVNLTFGQIHEYLVDSLNSKLCAHESHC